MFDSDLDEQIKACEDKIKALKASKEKQNQKHKALEKLNKEINKLCAEKHITLEDLYTSQSDQIEKWIKKVVKQNPDSKFCLSLKRLLQNSKTTTNKAQKSKNTKDKLEVGVYENPSSKERIEKIKRNPKQLDNWIEEHGLSTVKAWKVS